MPHSPSHCQTQSHLSLRLKYTHNRPTLSDIYTQAQSREAGPSHKLEHQIEM